MLALILQNDVVYSLAILRSTHLYTDTCAQNISVLKTKQSFSVNIYMWKVNFGIPLWSLNLFLKIFIYVFICIVLLCG
jgi:hypothetical protein